MRSSSNNGTSRGNRGFTSCTVKKNLGSGIDYNALALNCHFYVVEATLENNVWFSRLRLCSLKGCQKDVSRVAVLTDLENDY